MRALGTGIKEIREQATQTFPRRVFREHTGLRQLCAQPAEGRAEGPVHVPVSRGWRKKGG